MLEPHSSQTLSTPQTSECRCETQDMESLQSVVSRGSIFRRSSVDDLDLSGWRRNRQWQRHHYYSSSQSNGYYKLRPLPPELLSCGLDHTSLLTQSVFHRTPKYTRHSSPLHEKNLAFHRSASGSQLTLNGSVYAGARFSEAPSPKLLPLPPRHWLDGINEQCPAVCGEMTKQLKSVLQVK